MRRACAIEDFFEIHIAKAFVPPLSATVADADILTPHLAHFLHEHVNVRVGFARHSVTPLCE
jgi:hypothetical protein